MSTLEPVSDIQINQSPSVSAFASTIFPEMLQIRIAVPADFVEP